MISSAPASKSHRLYRGQKNTGRCKAQAGTNRPAALHIIANTAAEMIIRADCGFSVHKTRGHAGRRSVG
jgi:hypothetical protein